MQGYLQGIGFLLSRYDIILVLWIDIPEQFDGYVQHHGDLFQVQVVVHHDGIRRDRKVYGPGVELVFPVIVHGIGGRNEGRHMTSRLPW